MIAAAALAVAAAGVSLFWLRRRYLVVTVRGDSMAPTYVDGDRLLVRRTRRGVRAGRCVVFAEPDGRPGLLVKRAVAVPGRHPDGHVYVLGDNPDHSYDSRHYGYVAADRMVGIVLRSVSSSRARTSSA